MFRRAPVAEEPRFLKDLLRALRESEETLAEDSIAAEQVLAVAELAPEALPAAEPESFDAIDHDQSEMQIIRAELKLLRELSAEWKEAVRVDREQTAMLPDYQIAIAA